MPHVVADGSILTACGSKDDGKKDDGKASESKADVVMITDVGTIDDKSFNQGTWEGVKAYGEETGKKVEYIKPTEKSDNAYKEAIDQAVNKYKAKVIVTPGYLFEPSIYEKQDTYPDVKFILIDCYPNDGAQENAKFKTAKNTVGIKYSENEAGYMAGYAIVKEGKTKLGFMGGIAVPAVVNSRLRLRTGSTGRCQGNECRNRNEIQNMLGTFQSKC